MALRLRGDVDPKVAADQIQSAANQAERFRAGAGSDTQVINDYVQWADSLQRVLLAYFKNPDLSQLFTQRYFHLHNLMHATGGRRVPEMVAAEVEVQIAWLTNEAAEMLLRAGRFPSDGSPFSLVVPDTGMFLHGPLTLADVPWRTYSDVLKEQIRLVVPIRVIEELDRLKDAAPTKVRHRARIALKQLSKLITPPNEPSRLAEGVSIESFVALEGQREVLSGDSDILVACDEIETYSRHKVRVVTRDLAMSLRAQTAGFDACFVQPDAERTEE